MPNILQLDNSGFYRRTLQGLFTVQGYGYFGVQTVDEAFKVLDEYSIDVILTALELQDADAAGFLKRLGEDVKNRSIPVMVITSSDTLEDRRRMFGLGVVDYITKDTEPSDIVASVSGFLKQSRQFPGLESVSVAVIEDSPFEQKVLRAVLNRAGAAAVSYFDSAEDFQRRGGVFDLYLVDIVLTGESGESLVQKVRMAQPNALILALSGVDHPRTISHILTAGADDYLVKPFHPDVFQARLRSLIRIRNLVKELEECRKK